MGISKIDKKKVSGGFGFCQGIDIETSGYLFFGLRRSSVLGFRGLLGVRSFGIKVGFLRFRVFRSFKVVEFLQGFLGLQKPDCKVISTR